MILETRLNHTSLKILAHIIASAPYPPTIRELMRVTGFKSPNGVKLYLKQLRKLGLVTWEEGHARTLKALCRLIPADELEDWNERRALQRL